MTSHTLGSSAIHTLSIHLVPGSILVLGGAVAWSLWRQRKQEQQQHKLVQHIGQIETQVNALATEPMPVDTTEAEPVKASVFQRLFKRGG